VSPCQAGGGQITIRPLRRALSNATAYLPLCGRARRPLGSTAAVSQATGTEQARAHNAHVHPSGVLEPSQADELITRRLKEALALIDVRVLDHFIVGDGACTSFSERGLL
jgi:hypothetical protein